MECDSFVDGLIKGRQAVIDKLLYLIARSPDGKIDVTTLMLELDILPQALEKVRVL